MRYFVYLFLQCCAFALWSQGQSPLFIEGQLKDGTTKETLPFAKIYNKSLQKGTITDDEGFFHLEVVSDTDDVIVTYIGYQKQSLFYKRNLEPQDYFIEKNVLLTEEVKIYPLDLPYLYELLYDCKSKASIVQSNGKAIYELKTFMEDDQIELVEGYYNFKSNGYDLDKLDLKTGRLGVKWKDEKMFVSLESSRAISVQSLLYENDYFPINPLEFRPKKMRNNFSLRLISKYLDDNKDSVYIIAYTPRNDNGQYFSGNIWVNKTQKNILKMETNCTDCKRHPFLPIFPTDTIQKLDLAITRSFREVNGQMGFKHVDFNYKIDYKSRFAGGIGQNYSVNTKAVIYAYAFDEAFYLPRFEFSDPNIGDYRKVNAIPYNDFFWERNDEEKIADRKNRNQIFYNDTSTIRSGLLFQANDYFQKGLLEHPYRSWSEKRLMFRDPDYGRKTETTSTFRVSSGVGVVGPKYKLSVKVFADLNTYSDTTSLLTATIFDPYESFSNLPFNSRTHCFINMYFDLHEIGRRLFLESIQDKKLTPQSFDMYYNQFFNQFEEVTKEFLRDAEQGNNEEKIRKWNAYIVESLQIDNVALFRPFNNPK